MLATRLRAGVERDRIKRDIEAVYDPEGPARLAMALERLLAGLIVIGLPRNTAMEVVETVAMDFHPPLQARFLQRTDKRVAKHPSHSGRSQTADDNRPARTGGFGRSGARR